MCSCASLYANLPVLPSSNSGGYQLVVSHEFKPRQECEHNCEAQKNTVSFWHGKTGGAEHQAVEPEGKGVQHRDVYSKSCHNISLLALTL